MVFGCALPANLIIVDKRNLFRAVFDEKNLNFLKYLAGICDKKIQ